MCCDVVLLSGVPPAPSGVFGLHLLNLNLSASTATALIASLRGSVRRASGFVLVGQRSYSAANAGTDCRTKTNGNLLSRFPFRLKCIV